MAIEAVRLGADSFSRRCSPSSACLLRRARAGVRRGGQVVAVDDDVSRWVADSGSPAASSGLLASSPGSAALSARRSSTGLGRRSSSWRRARQADAAFVGLAVLGITVLVAVLKAIYERARPGARQRDPAAALVLVSERPRGDGGRALRRARAAPRRAGALAARGPRRGSSAAGARCARDRSESRPPQRPLRLRRRRRVRRRPRLALLLRDRAGRADAPAGRRPAPAVSAARHSYHRPVADQENQPLAQLLEELGAQLDWVREYL